MAMPLLFSCMDLYNREIVACSQDMDFVLGTLYQLILYSY